MEFTHLFGGLRKSNSLIIIEKQNVKKHSVFLFLKSSFFCLKNVFAYLRCLNYICTKCSEIQQ